MHLEQVVAFLAFAFVAAVTPGPSNIMVMAAGSRHGLVGGLPCLTGVVTGMALLMGGASLGLASVTTVHPEILTLLRWGGSVLLLWLAWRIASAGTNAVQHVHAPVGFWGALAFQWVNPKSWVVAASAAAAYGSGFAGTPWMRACVIATLFALAATPSLLLWLVFGSTVRTLLRSPRQARVVNVSMGLLLVASVCMMLVR